MAEKYLPRLFVLLGARTGAEESCMATHLRIGVLPYGCGLLALCNKGFIFWERMSDCRGFDGGGMGYGARMAGPARDMRPWPGAGFLMVAGTGRLDRTFA